MRSRINAVLTVAVLGLLILGMSGCSTIKTNPYACDIIRDAAYAVSSYGCGRLQDPNARDACSAAGLAASLIARESCLKQQALAAGKNMLARETGDPIPAPMGVKAELHADALAIMHEYETLEADPDLVKGVR